MKTYVREVMETVVSVVGLLLAFHSYYLNCELMSQIEAKERFKVAYLEWKKDSEYYQFRVKMLKDQLNDYSKIIEHQRRTIQWWLNNPVNEKVASK